MRNLARLLRWRTRMLLYLTSEFADETLLMITDRIGNRPHERSTRPVIGSTPNRLSPRTPGTKPINDINAGPATFFGSIPVADVTSRTRQPNRSHQPEYPRSCSRFTQIAVIGHMTAA